jgi:ABC-type ATPase with predicted acetyltransferase domain
MEDKNKLVLDQLVRKAFPQVESYDYKITDYSLNTTFGFKFDNLAHFTEFLQQHQSIGVEELKFLKNVLKDLNLQHDSFFYVNFFK